MALQPAIAHPSHKPPYPLPCPSPFLVRCCQLRWQRVVWQCTQVLHLVRLQLWVQGSLLMTAAEMTAVFEACIHVCTHVPKHIAAWRL